MFSKMTSLTRKTPAYFNILINSQTKRLISSPLSINNLTRGFSNTRDENENSNERREFVKEKYDEAMKAHTGFVIGAVHDATKKLEKDIADGTEKILTDTEKKLEVIATQAAENLNEKGTELQKKLTATETTLGKTVADLKETKEEYKRTREEYQKSKRAFYLYSGIFAIFIMGVTSAVINFYKEKMKQQKDTLQKHNEGLIETLKTSEEATVERNQRLLRTLTPAMTITFADAGNTDYDDAIKSTRKKINEECGPCEASNEIISLLRRLEKIKEGYATRPCIEGYCFGVFTPHKPRIDRRIRAIEQESIVYEVACQKYKKL